jgi:hypothetical protein
MADVHSLGTATQKACPKRKISFNALVAIKLDATS